jgi:hypothetical protein
MPMVKKSSTATAPAPVAEAPKAETPAQTVATPENGTAAAINRLQKKTEAAPAAAKTYAGRDFDKEAHGKTRCVQFEAALMSPAIAGMKFDTMEQYLALCKQAADYGTAYTFGETK